MKMDKNLNENDQQMVSLNRPNDGISSPRYEEVEEQQGITLAQIWHMIVKHWVALVILVFVGLIGGVLYSKVIKSPKYQASVQLMVVSHESASSSTTENINAAITKTKIAYGYITTDEVATAVAKKLNEKEGNNFYIKDGNGKYTSTLDLTSVKKLYSVSIPTVTTNSTSVFLSITSTCKTEALAIDVVNYVASSTIELSNQEGSQIYDYLKDSLVTLGSANYATDSSTSTLVIGLIGVLIGAVVGAAYAIIRELTNTHVSSKADLETVTGYKVIGMIPKYENKVNADEPTTTGEGEKKNA